MARLFISYSHHDEQYRNELEAHLAPLRRQRVVEVWHDRRIGVGDDFDQTIRQNLEDADLILFLISHHFLASDYCQDVEMTRALERHERGEARVISVILDSCDWEHSEFAKLLVAPTDGKPILKHANRNDGFLDVVRQIREVAGSPPPRSQNTVVRHGESASPRAESAPRSGNLRTRRTFTDLERSEFRTATFEYLFNFFSNSMKQVALRNPELEGRVRRIDGNSFVATIYRNGAFQNGCRVFLSSSIGEIGLALGENPSDGSYNEWLTIEHDGYVAGLKPGGMQMGGSSPEGVLTQEGAAEYFWGILIERLQ